MNLQIVPHAFALHIVQRCWNGHQRIVLIHDPGDEYDTVQEIRRRGEDQCLFLQFYDLHKHLETHRGPIREDIEQAIEFGKDGLETAPDRLTLVSCTAGVSRSSATAFVMRCAVMEPIEAAKVWNPRVHYPNRLICELGADILGKPEMIDVMEDFTQDRNRRRAIKGKPPRTEV